MKICEKGGSTVHWKTSVYATFTWIKSQSSQNNPQAVSGHEQLPMDYNVMNLLCSNHVLVQIHMISKRISHQTGSASNLTAIFRSTFCFCILKGLSSFNNTPSVNKVYRNFPWVMLWTCDLQMTHSIHVIKKNLSPIIRFSFKTGSHFPCLIFIFVLSD